jgi:phage tail sheath protein FI
VCGTIASRTLERGAWLAPANIPLTGAVALDPSLSAEAGRLLLDAGVNLIAPDPRGFVTLGADTLTGDASLRPIGVRRLLSLLRRLALREGTTYVFENNDAAFREDVRQRFDRLLADLYGRGAFAGATAPEGYRVVADESVNPASSVDLGRLIVELRVAPSRPLTFIAVRLLQTATDRLVLQEA